LRFSSFGLMNPEVQQVPEMCAFRLEHTLKYLLGMADKVSSAGIPSGIPSSADAPPAGGPRKPSKWQWLVVGMVLLVLALPALMHFFPGGTSGGAPANPLQLSYLKFQEKKYQESIDAANEYLKTVPNSAEAWNNIAVSHLMLGRYDEALRDAATALRLDPNSQLARNNLRWIVTERAKARGGNDVPTASAGVSKSAVLLNLSLQQYNSKQFAACVESAKSAIKLDPNYAEGYNNIAACESASGHYDAAIAAAREALRLKPDFELARNNLNWAMKERAGK